MDAWCPGGTRWLASIALLLLVWATTLTVAFGGVRITEFLPENDGGLRDADDESPDWIELFNDSPAGVDLGGWHLTDDLANLAKWTFPATNLPSGGFLVVFASGKNRAVAGAELHTNFRLNNGGELLALVEPDGVTIGSAFTNYPATRRNISYGPGNSNAPPTTIMPAGFPARWFIPTNASLGETWTQREFNDASWTGAITPLRYDVVGGAGAPLLSVDINDRDNDTAANTQSGFQSFIVGNVGGNGAVQSGPITRSFGAFTVTLSNSSAAFGYDDRFRTTPVNAGAFTLEDLFRDFVFSRDNAGTSGLDVIIDGLAPAQPCFVTVWSFDSGSAGTRVSDWAANGIVVTNDYTFNGADLPTNDDQDHFSFNAVSDGSGSLVLSGRRDLAARDQGGGASFGVFLNAFEIASLGDPSTNGNLAALAGRNASVYVRQTFTVADPTAFNQLILRIRYDDGFVAYLNGVEVARRNAPANPAWDSAASATHSAGVPEDITLPDAAALLVPGDNLLAIQGLNAAVGDATFQLDPQLLATLNAVVTGRFFKPPTPGAANDFGYEGLVADTKFSVDRGFYEAPFNVTITSATPGAVIYWTTNGSEPGPGNGTVYSAPVPVNGTTLLRAAAYRDGLIPTEVDTHTYLFLDQVLQQPASLPGYPTTWQASYPADYGMDPNVVNSTNYGPTLKTDLRSIPTLSLVMRHADWWDAATGIYPNATSRGDAWIRAASAELILPDGTNAHTGFAVNCGVSMQGNASRDNVRTPKHAFRLRFDSQYGPSKLRYDWFKDSPVQQFDNLVLRACFTDSWSTRYSDTTVIPGGRGTRYRPEDSLCLRDVWMKDSELDLGHHAARNTFVHLYINGLYWGLYNPCERLDSSHFSEYFGGREMDWDVLAGDAAYNVATVMDGDNVAWNEMMSVVSAGITTEAAYQAVQQRVDVDGLIDYMLLHFHGEAEDWPHHNWYTARRRETNGLPATRWIFTVWDQEIVCDQLVARNLVAVNNPDTPAFIYSQLRAWPEFRVRFGDRVHRHLFHDGALTASHCVARMQARANEVTNAIVGESARWGDAREFPTPNNPVGTGQTFTRDEWWVPELQKLFTNWFPRQVGITLARLRAAGLYPTIGAPEFNQFGGAIPAGFGLVMTHTNASGTIYFTLDGSDPRQYGSGTVSPTAQTYDAPAVLNAPTLARARVLSDGQWSALAEAAFYPPQDLSKLALTEIMYHPPDMGATNGEEFEFIELKNAGTNSLDLSGLTFTAGVSATFTNGTLLEPGDFLVLVRNPAAFASRYPGVAIGGVFSGKLDNAGETLTLSHPLGASVFSVTYDDIAPWPVAPDGFGFSLVPLNAGLTQAPDDGAKWRASATVGGSPGADDPDPAIPAIVINEILSASVLPEVDRVELHNPTTASADVSGWFLTDDATIPGKFRIPEGTTLAPGGFVVFDETQFNPNPGDLHSFALGSRGDSVYLFAADANGRLTGYNHGFSFGAAAAGVTFGRQVNSAGEEQFPAQIAPTFGTANAGPRVGPVVINEIHYHPAAGGDEFVELKNITGAPVPLFDPLYPTNTWRLNGIGFDFPTDVTLEANALLLLVATNPPGFRAKYNVAAGVVLLGPYAGALQDSGERLRLERPEMFGTNGLGYISVDEVRYNDKAPWPPAADGSGPSLQRIASAAYGDDPINWVAATPTPGTDNASLDSDGDGLPDEWELANGTQPGVPDANDDPDGDGLTNRQEYEAGTDPLLAESTLRLEDPVLDGGATQFWFLAVSNRTYSVLASDAPDGAGWARVVDVSARPTNRVVTVSAPLDGATRFYRVVTPSP